MGMVAGLPAVTEPSLEQALAEYRAVNVPLYNAQPLKLGVFATNLSGHVLCSAAPTGFEMSWRHSLAIAEQVDRMGLEVVVPAARWLGYGGATGFHDRTFETLTYAAGLLAATRDVMVFSTVHAAVVNPVVAAKAIATIDHISNGRAGLNIVMGWYAREMAMLGVELREHADRYRHGAEWMGIVDAIWRGGGPFDFEGEYFRLEGVRGDPKPVQPRPVLINAGVSPAGVDFSARRADFNFTIFHDEAHATGYVDRVRRKAWEEHRRRIGMLTTCVVVCRDTEREAREAYRTIVDHADWAAARAYLASQNVELDALDADARDAFLERFVAGAASRPIVGTPEQVVDALASIRRAGIDGVLLGMVDYVEELPYFERRVLPLMKQHGLRV